MTDEPKDPKPLRKVGYPFQKTDTSVPAQPKQIEIKDANEYFQALAQAEDGFYPIGYNGQWHGGIHFGAQTAATLAQEGGIRCIADGEVAAYRINNDYPSVEYKSCAAARYSSGFVLVRHRLQLPPAPRASSGGGAGNGASAPDNGTSSQQQTEPSVVFYSLYMHVANWKAYEAEPKLSRPGFWDGAKEYVVGEKASDKEEALAPGQTGLRVRDSNHQPIAILPRGARLTLGAAVADRRGFHEISAITSGDSVPAGQHIGRVYLPELDAISTPRAKDSVVVLSKPVEIKAGDLVGHLGQYQRYSDMNPMASTCSERPLVQLDVFTGDDLEAFIVQSRARDGQLDAAKKTLLHIKPGARLVQPTQPNLDLPAGESALISADAPATGRWVKGRRGTVQTIDKGLLRGFSSTTRSYGNGNLFIAAVNPSSGSELSLEQYEALSSAEQRTYTQRKVLVPADGDVWLDRNAANQAGLVQGPNRVWSQFPLSVANVSGDPAEHARTVATKSAEATAADAEGTRWFEVDAGGGATGTLHGWVCESGHANVELCSPWAWPGFVLMDTGSLQPRDLYGRALSRSRQALPEERGEMDALSQRAEQSPLFDALCQAIDADGKDGITPLELRQALGKPWLAQALSRLAIKHHSEWAGPMDRWDAIDDLITDSRKDDWKAEKDRIKQLMWWDEASSFEGFPASARVHCIHPIALVDNFHGTASNSCFPLKDAQEIALRVSGGYEGRANLDYHALADDFDGQGTSFGLIQWNFGQNTLGPLLLQMYNRDPTAFEGAFPADSDYQTLETAVRNQNQQAQLTWARNVLSTNRAAWSQAFNNLGDIPAFQEIQLNAVLDYHQNVVKAIALMRGIAPDLMREVQVGTYSALYDLSVQQGTIDKNGSLAAARKRYVEERPGTQVKFVEIVVQERARTASTRWRADAMSRRMGIIQRKPYSAAESGHSATRSNANFKLLEETHDQPICQL